VAHHPERLPSALLFRVLCPDRQLTKIDIAQTHAILVRRKAALVRPGGLRPAGSGGSGSGPSATGTRPDSTTRSGRAAMCGTDHGAEAATVTSAHPIGTAVIERGIGSDQTLDVEGGVGGECRVINRRDKVSRGLAE
jgi:hypothetical protein